MTSPLLENIERFEKARDELRELVREAHAAAKDLRAAAREAAKERADLQAVIETGAHDAIEEKLADAVAEGLEELGKAMSDQMRKSVEKILAEFEQLKNRIFTGVAHTGRVGTDRDLRVSLPRKLGGLDG